MRRPLLVANWKLNKTVAEAQSFAAALRADGAAALAHAHLDVAIAPPFTALWPLAQALQGSHVALCGQDLYPEDRGAYTGAVSAPLVAEAGASYVLVGHSERRALFGETLATSRARVAHACAHNLRPIVCVGESAAEREAQLTHAVVARQLLGALEDLLPDQLPGLVVAYEPVWAIGTGQQADAATACAVHAEIRRLLRELGGEAFAAGVRILYGGSVTVEGIATLLAAQEVDGALVGGASLQAEGFAKLVRRAEEACRGR